MRTERFHQSWSTLTQVLYLIELRATVRWARTPCQSSSHSHNVPTWAASWYHHTIPGAGGWASAREFIGHSSLRSSLPPDPSLVPGGPGSPGTPDPCPPPPLLSHWGLSIHHHQGQPNPSRDSPKAKSGAFGAPLLPSLQPWPLPLATTCQYRVLQAGALPGHRSEPPVFQSRGSLPIRSCLDLTQRRSCSRVSCFLPDGATPPLVFRW